jgi:CBS domain-containing protein
VTASAPAPARERAVGEARTVGEVMRPGIVTCARTATATDLARMMRDCHTDCIVILSNGHSADQFPVVWGLVTRDDLLRPIAEVDPTTPAEDLARTPVVRARVDLTIAEAQSLCAAVGVSHLLVVDSAHGTPLGLVSDVELSTHAATTGAHERKTYRGRHCEQCSRNL